jgi:hypothetical protein
MIKQRLKVGQVMADRGTNLSDRLEQATTLWKGPDVLSEPRTFRKHYGTMSVTRRMLGLSLTLDTHGE